MSLIYWHIKQKYQLGPASHMTHIDNFPNILESGGLLSHNAMRGKIYEVLSNDDVQKRRATILVSISGRPLHDYVPLYFGFKTPMVAYNQDHNEKIIFLRYSLNILTTKGLIFTDGNARSKETNFYKFIDIASLSSLNISSINTVKYADAPSIKRQKQAEILIPDFLDNKQILDILVFSDRARNEVLANLLQYGIKKPVTVAIGHYFKGPP